MTRREKRRGPTDREGGRAVLLILVVVALLCAGGYVAAYAGADGKLPTGTRVAGIDVGGRSPQSAARVLEAGMAGRLRAPITLSVGEQTFQVTPADAGLSVDYLASVTRALGPRSWAFNHLWNYYTGGGDHPPVVDVDEGRMGALLDQLDDKMGSAPRDAGISLVGGTIRVIQPREGATIAHDKAATAIRDAWVQGLLDVQLPLQLTAPVIGVDDVQAAIRDLANPALAAPVTLVFARSRATLTPHDYASMLTIAPHNGRLALGVVRTDLAGLVDPTSHDTTPRDASIALADGAPRLVRAKSGHRYDARGVETAFLAAVDQTGDQRTVKVHGDRTPATFGNHDARALGVKEVVATYAVPVPAKAGANLASAAGRLSGVLLRPGATFSFDQTVAITSGSASRLATATWNAAFLAGLTDVHRSAPATAEDVSLSGRDATVGPGVDLAFRNDTDHGVLLDAQVGGGQVTVRVFSTKEWDVTAAVGAPYDLVPRGTVTDTSAGCRPSPGADGYAVDLVRTYRPLSGSAPAHSDTVTTTYQPVAAVVCATAGGA